MDLATKKALKDHLYSFITENKKQLIDEILPNRTRYMTVVLEDLLNSFNANAVIRSADCFGVQDVHVIENENKYAFNPHVAKGSAKWVDRHYYNELPNNTAACVKTLKEQGYRIVATTPHTNDVLLPNFDVTKGKFALVFGTEQFGITKEMESLADEFLRIPMYGFTESYNISVSAALCFYDLRNKLENSDVDWKLTEEEMLNMQLDWARKIVKRSWHYEKEFLAEL